MSTAPKTVAFHTMGCKLNFSETSTISRDFIQQGFKRVDYRDWADIYVINTCSVTDNADKEARKLVRQAKRQNPDSSVAVIGCYAQLKPDEIANSNFDLLTSLKLDTLLTPGRRNGVYSMLMKIKEYGKVYAESK